MPYGNVNQTDVLSDLSFLEGNQSTPTTGIDDWKTFVQRTLEEAWRAYPWDFAKTIASVSMVSGIGTLASGAQINAIYDVRYRGSGTGDDHIYTQIPYEEQDDWDASQYRYWVTGQPFQPVINTTWRPILAYWLGTRPSQPKSTLQYPPSSPIR
jgi:hypothetical protein